MISPALDVFVQQALRLSIDERIELTQDIWGSISSSPDDIPTPQWVFAELDRRLADPDEQATLTWDQVEEGLNRKR